ncbi:hypothetical protein L210DRAFT_3651637 [Boletus edulis BED1]|uniref:Uncharacterized protein n=1 Tax=Boletus edulis BED1 TaxID=1328754 RepID=A0AAD4BH33_BOLED|nr:hypothetical protein L210DRAFT_3651637 [Boletus edulis BED1]
MLYKPATKLFGIRCPQPLVLCIYRVQQVLYFKASSLVEDIEESLPTTAHPLSYPHTVVDIPPTGWATGHPEAGFLPGHPSTFNFVDPPFRIDGSSFPGENVQMVGPEAVQSPLYTSTLTLEELGWLCGWKNEDGTLCDGDLHACKSANAPGQTRDKKQVSYFPYQVQVAWL